MKIPVLKVTPWQEDAGKKVMGSNPGARKGFFSPENSLKVQLFDQSSCRYCTIKILFGLMFY